MGKVGTAVLKATVVGSTAIRMLPVVNGNIVNNICIYERCSNCTISTLLLMQFIKLLPMFPSLFGVYSMYMLSNQMCMLSGSIIQYI